MARTVDSGTRTTLLGQLQHNPTDPAAWGEFVDHYGRKILGWCRKWDLQEADAQDIAQEVLLKLAVQMRHFRYDPSQSFRAWLKTLAQHAWSELVQGSGDSQVAWRLQTAEARDDLIQHLEAEFDRELLEAAVVRVRLRIEPRTWDAFRLLAFEGLSGAEAAERFGMKVATVFVARSKVQKMLQQEVQRLEGAAPKSE